MTAIARRRGGAAVVAVFSVTAIAGVGLSATTASGPPILAARWGLLARLGLWATVWAVSVAAALVLPQRLALVLIVATALALRMAALAGPSTTSDDLYRYSWDGRVQASGIDPYSQPPISPQLQGLREPWLWPDDAGCAALRRPPGCTRINRPGVRTIYPPVAEAWFAAIYRAGGIDGRDKIWQAAGLVTDMAVVGLLIVTLRRSGRDPRWVALYALSPIPVLEIVNNAHVDGLATLFVVGALAVAAGRGQQARREVMVGVLLGLAALVKLYPALLLPAVAGMAGAPRARATAGIGAGTGGAGAGDTAAGAGAGEEGAGVGAADAAAGGGGRWAVSGPVRSVARAGAAMVAVVVIAYLPHIASVGWRVVGYLPGYLKEEHYNQGGRFLLAGSSGLPGPAVTALAAAAVLGSMAWVLWRRPPFSQAAAVLLGVLFLTTTPVQPWYAASLIAVAAACAWPWWAAVGVAGYPYFFAIILDYRHPVGLGRACYGAALIVLVAAGARRAAAKPGTR